MNAPIYLPNDIAEAALETPDEFGKLELAAYKRQVFDAARQGSTSFPYYFDQKDAVAPIRFAHEHCRHSKGEWAGQLIELQPWEQFIYGSLFGWKRKSDHTRRFRVGYIEVPRKNGKALAIDTRLPTPTGWTTMGDIRVGDTLFDERGLPCTVTGATDVMLDHECYAVRFSDGAEIVADAGHLWRTNARRPGNGTRGKRRTPEDDTRTTKQILATLSVGKGRIEWNHSIDVADPLEIPPAVLLVPPYTLGAWLGDGTSSTAAITCADDDDQIIREIESEGIETRRRGEHRTNSPGYGLGIGGGRGNRKKNKLRLLGVLNNKHIPPQYLRASRTQREALLQGLMDTDGTASKAGQCEFTTTTPALARGFIELARTLGLKPTTTEGRATLYGRDCGPKWRIQIWPTEKTRPFRLLRKLARCHSSAARSSSRQIVAINPVQSVPVRCIQVNSPSSLYLAGDSMIPTHNSTLLAIAGPYLAFLDGEPGAEVYSVATKKDQARIIFDESKRIVEADRQLSGMIEVLKGNMNDGVSKFEPLGRDSKTQDGLNVHGCLIDEIHKHKTSEMIDVMQSASGARRQPLRIEITTAGVYEPTSVCWLHHDYSRNILEAAAGESDAFTDDTWFAFIASADPDDDWTSPATWRKANPNFGISVKEEYLTAECDRAKRIPSEQNTFRQMHTNFWPQQVTRSIDMTQWIACAQRRPLSELLGKKCYGGLDLASTMDQNALALVFPDESTEDTVDVLVWYWMPSEGLLEKQRAHMAQYVTWADQGHLILTDGNVVDYEKMRTDIIAICERYDVQEIAYDRWNQAQIVPKLIDHGLPMIPFGQGFASMSDPCKQVLRLVAAGRFRHGGHPLMHWNAANVQAKHDEAENMKWNRRNTRTQKIDGLVAATMALGRKLLAMDPQQGSATEKTGGIRVIDMR